jgi:CheY-like chemotaxis protein
MKQRRSKIDAIIDNVSQLKKEVDAAASLVDLSNIENRFNQTIQELTYDDLTKEDRIILKAFKITWETKHSILSQKNDISRLEPEDGVPASGITSELIRAYIQQAYNLKEIVDFASIPRDAEAILNEYNRMKTEEYYAQLSSDEKKLFDTIGPYIEKTLEDLKVGKKKTRQLSLTTLSFDSVEQTPTFKTEDYFTEIYEIRNRVVTARSNNDIERIQRDFNGIDKAMKEQELTDRQKSVLADTERLINDAKKHFERESKLKFDLTKDQQRTQHEIEKEALIKELLGADHMPEHKRRIFFVEGNTFERELVKKHFEKEGFYVEAVDSFNYDNSFFSMHDFDVILIDDDIIKNTTGLDFVLQLKKNEIYDALPPIVIHSNNSVSWLYSLLKRKGITQRFKVFVTSKRDLDKNVQFIKDIIG